jgi:hypothetical protein
MKRSLTLAREVPHDETILPIFQAVQYLGLRVEIQENLILQKLDSM